ncbi:hypothetical protein EDC94DRAFT_603502 [Helicostylum pulchrum]|nr:hypothetical protein EDC94DRAFT_603502 [Helicostylum pulchrum]
MKDLPAEIYTNIFVYLKRKDLQTCCFVCKTWYRTAIQLSWEEVTLRTHNISLMKSDFNNLYHTQYLKYSRLIKTLAFEDAKNYGDPDKFDRKELLELLNLSPNLKVIDFSKTNYLEKYLGYLLDSDLQHIKRIYTGRDFMTEIQLTSACNKSIY